MSSSLAPSARAAFRPLVDSAGLPVAAGIQANDDDGEDEDEHDYETPAAENNLSASDLDLVRACSSG